VFLLLRARQKPLEDTLAEDDLGIDDDAPLRPLDLDRDPRPDDDLLDIRSRDRSRRHRCEQDRKEMKTHRDAS